MVCYLLLFFLIPWISQNFSFGSKNSIISANAYHIIRPEGLDNGHYFQVENITLKENLNNYFKWGNEVVEILQGWNNKDAVLSARYLNWLGEEGGYLFIALIVFYMYNLKNGLTISAMITCGSMFVYSLKLAFAFPRPYWTNTQIFVYECSGGSFSFPSAFIVAPTVTITWIALSDENYGNNFGAQCLTWILLTVYDTFILIIRIYLGATHLMDVIASYFLGFLVIFFFKGLFLPIATWAEEKAAELENLKFLFRLLCVLILVGMAIGWAIATFYIGKIGRDIDPLWKEIHDMACPTILFEPDRFQDVFFWTGAWSGLLFAMLFLYRFCNFLPSSGSFLQKILRICLSVLGSGFWFFLPLIDDKVTNDALSVTLYSISGFLTIFWAFFLSAWIGAQIGLIPYVIDEEEEQDSLKDSTFELY